MKSLEQACSDIIMKNMNYSDECIYLLYDTESPLAISLSDAFIQAINNQA